MKYYDIEEQRIYTVEELRTEWESLTEDEKGSAENFSQHLRNCLSKNGTLIPIYETPGKCDE